MKPRPAKYFLALGLILLGIGLVFFSRPLGAQPAWPFSPPPQLPQPTTPDAQRNALNQVKNQSKWLQNAIRTAPNYGAGGADVIWQQFQILRDTYTGFTRTLNPDQLARGANDWAELSAGLDIIQEAFTNYQNDLAGGRNVNLALRDLCQVMSDASQLWLQQLNKTCSQNRVGW